MTVRTRTLGTRLRHLIELLDGSVARQYVAAGLADYRPRYTPVVRVLLGRQNATIKEIAALAGLSHSAASQTVAQMAKAGFINTSPGDDARERIVSLTETAEAIVPRLQQLWAATNAAAAELDAELPYSLSRLLDEAIGALDRRPHDVRLADHHDKQ
jgi:DNA-binding MarR family transcriptional regulator